MAEERLQKILSRAGVGSRRAGEELIAAGRVRVNGQVAVLGAKADPERDKITVDGRTVTLAEDQVYVAVYKPRNVISAVSADDPRQTVRDLVPVPGHLYPVGRLDVDSEGLILLTNDGELANRLTHPRYGHEKEYRVLVARQPDQEQLEVWRKGVVLEDGYKTAPAEVRVESLYGKGAWLRVILREGRKRQIRETGSRLGLPVVRIIRIRIGSLQLAGLKPRQWRFLSTPEVDELKGRRPPAARSGPSRRARTDPTRSPSRRPRGGAGSRESRSSERPEAGKAPQKLRHRQGVISSPEKPARRQGTKPGAPVESPSQPTQPTSSHKKTERRGPRRPSDKGRRR